MARARHFAEKALELDPELALAQSVMGGVRLHADWDFEGAEEQFLRALDLDPGSVLAHQQYAVLLSYSGRIAEAIEQLEIARDLDPLTPDPGGVGLGRLYEMQGEPERALAAWAEKEALAPSYLPPYVARGDYLCRAGRYEEAIPLLTKALASEEPWPVANLAYCYAISGREDAARAKLAELTALAESQYVTPVGMARVHVGLGETEAAFAELERAYELRSLRLLGLRRDPHWQPLHNDPRYGSLLRRIGFPES
jgi:tetratricopeptide (TPR) repeat protein